MKESNYENDFLDALELAQESDSYNFIVEKLGVQKAVKLAADRLDHSWNKSLKDIEDWLLAAGLN